MDFSVQWIGMDVEGSDRDLIYSTNLVLASRIEENHETPHAWVVIGTGDLPNTGVNRFSQALRWPNVKH
jgi:hypothetical protein